MNYTKEEVLSLDKRTEEEQISILKDKGILKLLYVIDDGINKTEIYESLADCAFRLRDETISIWWLSNLIELVRINKLTEITSLHRCKPIHWIQAALLAKLESEK